MVNPTNTSTWPAWSLWPLLGPVPAKSVDFTQPINPGWSFGNLISVTEQNSSAPDTERDIVSVQRYGRQLGRVIDALAEIIVEMPKPRREESAFAKLVQLHEEINRIKSRSAARRLDLFVADLAELKRSDQSEYKRMAGILRETLRTLD